jgi:hypothetical protein
MKTKIYILLIITALLIPLSLLGTAGAAYLEGDTDDDNQRGKEYVPEYYVPPRYVPPRNNFLSFVRSLRVISGHPIRYKGLEIYFIKGHDYYIQSNIYRNIITLDEAYRRGVINIAEYDSGVVSKIRINSYSDSYIFIMAGEIISGGMQTRTMVKDILLPPRAKNIVVDVYCIEEGRWEAGRKEFTPAEPMLDSDIRKKVLREDGQDTIWSGIREHEKEAGSYSETHDLLEVYKNRGEDIRVKSEISRIVRRLPGNSIGMVAVKNGRILGIEAFYSHNMFEKQFHKLFRSYYYTTVPGVYYKNVTISDVRRFLKRLPNSRVLKETGYPGSGRLYDVSVNGFYGSALDFRGILHLSLIN